MSLKAAQAMRLFHVAQDFHGFIFGAIFTVFLVCATNSNERIERIEFGSQQKPANRQEEATSISDVGISGSSSEPNEITTPRPSTIVVSQPSQTIRKSFALEVPQQPKMLTPRQRR